MAVFKFESEVREIFLSVEEKGDALSRIGFVNNSKGFDNPKAYSLLLQEAYVQLKAYFEKRLYVFDLPINLMGTDFQSAVWKALGDIPYGEVRSYKDIAWAVKSPKAVRAVGQACHNNPIAIIVPCHRVVASSGKLCGYAGGLDYKQFLLELEKEKC